MPALTFLKRFLKPVVESTCKTVLQVSMGMRRIRHKPTTSDATKVERAAPQLWENESDASRAFTPSLAAVEPKRDRGPWITANSTAGVR